MGMDGYINKLVDLNCFFDVFVEVLNKGKLMVIIEVIGGLLVNIILLSFIDKF